MKTKAKKKVSSYTILNKWLTDGSKTTQLPEDVIKDKSISQLYLLYYFQSSHYMLYINKAFNNYNLFSIPRVEIFKFMKQCVMLSGYRPPFVQKHKKQKSKIVDIIKYKYPYLKKQELFMLVDVIDESDDKDSLYEMFGIYSPKKKKTTKAELKKMEKDKKTVKKSVNNDISLNDLIGNFS
jgi:hypothetical protein